MIDWSWLLPVSMVGVAVGIFCILYGLCLMSKEKAKPINFSKDGALGCLLGFFVVWMFSQFIFGVFDFPSNLFFWDIALSVSIGYGGVANG